MATRNRLTLGFFKRLVTPAQEESLVEGCRELLLGHDDLALGHLRNAAHLPDGAFLAGFLSLKQLRLDDAARFLESAKVRHGSLGKYFAKYDVAATMSLPVTDELTAHVGADLRGVLLGLVEVYQRQGRTDEAIGCLRRLRDIEPDDVVVKVSLAELLLDSERPGKSSAAEVVESAVGITNESAAHAALLLYKAKALRQLGLLEVARDTLTEALRRKKGRPVDLLRAVRYERALVYDDMGRKRRARSDLEKLYADCPDYEDVAARLGL